MASNAEIQAIQKMGPGTRPRSQDSNCAVLDGREGQVSAFPELASERPKTGPGTRCQCTPECQLILGPKVKHNARYWNRDHKKAAEKYRATIARELHRMKYRSKADSEAARFLMENPDFLQWCRERILFDQKMAALRKLEIKIYIPFRYYWEHYRRLQWLEGNLIRMNDHSEKFVKKCLANRYEDLKPFLKFKDR